MSLTSETHECRWMTPSSPSRFVFFTICALFYSAFCAKCHDHMNFDLCTSLDTLYQTTSVPSPGQRCPRRFLAEARRVVLIQCCTASRNQGRPLRVQGAVVGLLQEQFMLDSGRVQLGVRWAGGILFKSSAPGLRTVIFVLSELGGI